MKKARRTREAEKQPGHDWLEEYVHRDDYRGTGGPLDELMHYLTILHDALGSSEVCRRFRAAEHAQRFMSSLDYETLSDLWEPLAETLDRCSATQYAWSSEQKQADREMAGKAIRRLCAPRPAPPTATPGTRKEGTPDMLAIREAATLCGCTEKTIRNRLGKVNADGSPMIAGVIGKGRLTRIPRASLEPFRKRTDGTSKPARKHSLKKHVKREL